MAAGSSLHVLLLEKTLQCSVSLAFCRRLYKSLHRSTHSSEAQRRPYVTSRCSAVSQLRFWGLHCLPTASTSERLMVNHSQKCNSSPKNVFLCCSITWHISKVNVFYKLMSLKRKIKECLLTVVVCFYLALMIYFHVQYRKQPNLTFPKTQKTAQQQFS